jgi:hypothetical protein
VPASDFGRDTKTANVLPRDYAKQLLEQDPSDQRVPPALPTYTDLDGKVAQEIRSTRQPAVVQKIAVPVGAGERRDGGPLDQELKRSRMLGDREPVRVPPAGDNPRTDDGRSGRKTGAVGRPRIEPVPADREPSVTPPVREVPAEKRQGRDNRDVEPVRQPSYESPKERPRREPAPEPVRQPSYQPPPRQTRDDSPKPSRSDPPPSRPEPSRRSDPPPQKSDPPSKPAPPSDSDRGARKKDGR